MPTARRPASPAPKRAPKSTTLTLRDLNRATLARQHLLARTDTTPRDLTRALFALQAQVPGPPHVGLWTRLARFERGELSALVESRALVRATFLRGTLHLLDAEDYLRFRPVIQPVLARGAASVLRDRMKGFDLEALCNAAREFLAGGPRTFTEIRAHLIERFPKLDERAMGYTVRMHLPLVQTPGRGAWGFPSDASFGLADTWLGRAVPTQPDADVRPLILRYLAAFGPADARDFQLWSGLPGMAPLRAAFEALRPGLQVFTLEGGREVFDLPDAPRPGGDAPAPVRFVPDWDNLLLAHEDRGRVVPEAVKDRVFVGGLRVLGTVLVDGFVRATWKITREKKLGVLTVTAFGPLARSDRDAVVEEGERLARFAEPDATDWRVAIERA